VNPLFVTEAAGRYWIRPLLALACVGLAAAVVASAVTDDWAIAAFVLITIVVAFVSAALSIPLSLEIHPDRIVVAYHWRRSSVNLDKVASARPGRWWEVYSRFFSTNYATDFGHLVVLEKLESSRFDRGWLLSPQDRDGFIGAVNAAVERRR
jgi:hypothetical protein